MSQLFTLIYMYTLNFRCPDLLQMMADAAIDKTSSMVTMRQIISIVTCYCILMFARSNKNSAFQRMVTLLTVKGNTSDEVVSFYLLVLERRFGR